MARRISRRDSGSNGRLGSSPSRAVARRASKLSCANPLQTMSRSVTIPISRSFSAIGMAPISCSRHQFCEFGNRGVQTDPVDALVHRVFDFHGGPPLLELGTLDEMQRPRPSIFTVHWIRSAGLLGLSGGRAQSGVGIEVSMTLHESNHGTQNGKNGPVH